MADILIKNMDMPKDDEVLSLTVYPNGSVCLFMKEVSKAIALPEHGRLISDTDVKALLRSGLSLDSDYDMDYVCGLIDGLPTIVEANYGTDN